MIRALINLMLMNRIIRRLPLTKRKALSGRAALSLMVREGAVRHCIGNEREYQPHYLLPPAPAMLVV